MRIRPDTLRGRLTAWAVGVLALTLFCFGAASLAFLFQGLRSEFDRNLSEQYAYVERHLEPSSDGKLGLRKSGTSPTTAMILADQPRWIEVWSREGELLVRTGLSLEFSFGAPPVSEDLASSLHFSSVRTGEGSRFRVRSGLFEVRGRAVLIRGDCAVLKQVVVNMIDNAIKHCPAGTAIEVRFGSDPPNRPFFSVEDNGPGIAHEHLGKIFDRFYFVDRSRTRAAGRLFMPSCDS